MLTRERLDRFHNGSLFYQLAEEVAAGRASAWAMLRGAVRSGIREIYWWVAAFLQNGTSGVPGTGSLTAFRR